MDNAKAPQGSKSDWLTDRILRTLLWTVMKVPYRSRVPLMGWITSRIIAPLTGYRKRAETNLKMVYPEMGAIDRRNLATAVCDNFGRTLIENYSWSEFGAHLAKTKAQGPGLAAVDAAIAAERPVIFVTGHFGNHEAPRHVLTQSGLAIGGLYRPMANAFFNDHYAKTMSSWGGPVFEQGRKGTIGFAKHLRTGGMATLLFDVANSSGINISFLGHPARTATSAADLALRFDAVVIPYFGVRKPDGLSFDIIVEAPIPPGDPTAMMEEMTKRLEAHIIRDPHLWFWVHRRWKQRRSTD